MKTLHLLIDSNRRFYKTLFINGCARKKKLKSLSSGVFILRYSRTYVLNKLMKFKNLKFKTI